MTRPARLAALFIATALGLVLPAVATSPAGASAARSRSEPDTPGQTAAGQPAPEPPAADQAEPGTSGAGRCKPLVLRSLLATPAPGDLFLSPGTATCDQAEVQVTADAVAGVFTASFDLRYPSSIVKYAGFDLGPLLLQAPVGTKPLCLIQESVPGTLQVTMTRFAPDQAVSAQGSEVLLVLRFNRVAPGTGVVDFNLDPASPVAERVVDGAGAQVPARFGPGHGLRMTVYQR